MVKKKGRRRVPEPQTNIDLGHESIREEEDEQEEQPAQQDQASQEIMPHDKGMSSSKLHDQIHELIVRVDSFYDEHQKFEDSVNQ